MPRTEITIEWVTIGGTIMKWTAKEQPNQVDFEVEEVAGNVPLYTRLVNEDDLEGLIENVLERTPS